MIEVTGISNSEVEDRSLVYFNIDANNLTYAWKALVPPLDGVTLGQYLDDNSAAYIADIDAKEAIWLVCPKEREVHMPDGSIVMVPVLKEEVVFPTLQTPFEKLNVKKFFGRLIQEFADERWYILSKLGIGWTMQRLIEYPNETGLKAYILSLSADETLNSSDIAIIDLVFKEQGVDMGIVA